MEPVVEIQLLSRFGLSAVDRDGPAEASNYTPRPLRRRHFKLLLFPCPYLACHRLMVPEREIPTCPETVSSLERSTYRINLDPSRNEQLLWHQVFCVGAFSLSVADIVSPCFRENKPHLLCLIVRVRSGFAIPKHLNPETN